MLRVVTAFCIAIAISGCASHRSSSEIKPAAGARAAAIPTLAASILVTEDDILDRAYISLGDIEVSISKTTIFNEDPTNEMVNMRLREEAAKLGADAVILVRYGTVGVSAFSWGTLDGKGRAVKFTD